MTLRSGTHQIGEHAIKGGQFHNNEPCYFEEQVVINKKLIVQVLLPKRSIITMMMFIHKSFINTHTYTYM